MFDYVKDKGFLSHVRNLCSEIMQDFCHYLKEEYDIGAVFYLVGSGAKNLIVQNASLPIDLDYNLEIVRCKDFEDCGFIKECVRKSYRVFHGCLYCLQRYKETFAQTETQEDRIHLSG